MSAWSHALSCMRDIIGGHAAILHHLATKSVDKHPIAKSRSLLSNAAAAAAHCLFVTCGHIHGLTRVAGRAGQRPISAAPKLWISELRSHAPPAPGETGDSQWIKEAQAAFKSHSAATYHASFETAVKSGSQAVFKWLANATKAASPSLQISSQTVAEEIRSFRQRVSQLDQRCCPIAEQAAVETAAGLLSRSRNSLLHGSDPPTAFGNQSDGGSAALFAAPSMVARLCRKRPASKASARLPIAAIRPASYDVTVCLFITALLDLVWARADISSSFASVEIAHLFKGGSRDPGAIKSFRPLGLAEPFLSIIVDLLHLRIAHLTREFVGPLQLGGRSDPRSHILRFRVASSSRASLSLPSADTQGDARFGYGGGRHAQITLQLGHANIRPRNLLLFVSLLSKHVLRVRVSSGNGVIGLLEPVQLKGGGMVQGLGISNPGYNLLPAHLQSRILSAVPLACTRVAPPLLAAYYSARKDDVHYNMSLDVDNVRFRVWRLQKALDTAKGVWTATVRATASSILGACESDAERLLIFDWMRALDLPLVALFTDDFRTCSSSPACNLLVVSAVSSYARERGIVYECGPTEKSTISFEGLPAELDASAMAAHLNCLQGGTPTISPPVGRFLGAPEAAKKPAYEAAQDAIAQRDAVVSRGTCAAASSLQWPLAARRLYFTHGRSTVEYLLPLTVEHPRAAYRLNCLQERWAHAVLVGPWPGQRPRLSSECRNIILSDLGWTPLWHFTVGAAIMLRQRLLLAEHNQDDLSWLLRGCSPKSWTARVIAYQDRFQIPDADIQPNCPNVSLSAPSSPIPA